MQIGTLQLDTYMPDESVQYVHVCTHSRYMKKRLQKLVNEHREESVCLGMMQGTEDGPLSDLVILLRGESRVRWTFNCS